MINNFRTSFVNYFKEYPSYLIDPTRIFLWLWSLSTFIHFADRWEYPEFCFGLLAVCISTFLIKRVSWAWIIYLAYTTPMLVHLFPIIGNHLVFTLFVNFYLIYRLLRSTLVFDETLITPLRLSLAVVYFWAGIHKSNTDFINDPLSCAYSFAEQMNQTYYKNLLPASISRNSLLPFIIIGVEIFSGLLIAFRKTFFIGLVLALGLHMQLSAIEFVDFASVTLTILLISFFSYSHGKTDQLKKLFKLVPIFVLLEIFAGLYSFFELKKGRDSTGYWAQSLVYIFFALVVIFYGYRITWQTKFEAARLKLSNYTFPVLLLIFGSFNYLGLSTSGTFSMFSNIKTEGSDWNHLFIPKIFKIFNYQDKIYWVNRMDKRFVNTTFEHPIPDFGMPEIELSRNLSIWRKNNDGPHLIEYVLDGKTYKIRDILNDPQFLSLPYTWLENKLFYFRRIQKPEYHNACFW